MPCDHDEPDLRERCLYRIDRSCGLCMDACMVGAITGGGFDRDACEAHCNENGKTFTVTVCGKCLSGKPCTLKDPSV